MLKLDTGNYLFQVDMAEQNLANPDRIRWVICEMVRDATGVLHLAGYPWHS